MKNIKADSSMLMIVGGVVLMLLFGLLAVAFSSGVVAVSTGAIAKQQCKSSLEMVNNYNNMVDQGTNTVKESVSCDWNPFSGKSFCGNPFDPKWWARGTVTSAADAASNAVKVHTDLCIENTEDYCPITIGEPATADKAAECVYKRLVDTFYTLQGGRGKMSSSSISLPGITIPLPAHWESYEKRTNDKGDVFNLFKLHVIVEEPGNINLTGNCNDYFSSAVPTVLESSKSTEQCIAKAFSAPYICAIPVAQNTAKAQCNVIFGKITEATMTLTMISRCQEKGPDNALYCKCFADPKLGYNTYNGLPNIQGFYEASSGISIGSAMPYYLNPTKPKEESMRFFGCGMDTANFKGNSYITIGNAIIGKDNIVADESFNVKVGGEKICSTHLVASGASYNVNGQQIDDVGAAQIDECEAPEQKQSSNEKQLPI